MGSVETRPKKIVPFTTADIHVDRFYRDLQAGLKPRRLSVLEQLQRAKTVEELQNVVGDFLTLNASSGTRRKWHELAERRLGQLRVQALAS